MLVDQLFTLRPGEVVGSASLQWGTWSWMGTTSTAASLISTLVELPGDDFALVLASASFVLSPGVGQTADSVEMRLLGKVSGVDADLLAITVNPRLVTGAAGAAFLHSPMGAVVLPIHNRLDVVGRFSAGGAVNSFTASLFGFVMPRGNILRF